MKSIKTYLVESIKTISLFEETSDNKILDKIKKVIYNHVFMFTINGSVDFKHLPYYRNLTNLSLEEQSKYIVKNINNFKQYLNYDYNDLIDYNLSSNDPITNEYPDYKDFTCLKYLVWVGIPGLPNKKEIEKYCKLIEDDINNIYKEIKLGIDNKIYPAKFDIYLDTGKLPKDNPNYDGDTDDIDTKVEDQLEKVISDELNSMLDGYTCYIPSYDNEDGEEEVSWEEAIDSGYYNNIIDFLDAEFYGWREDIYKTLKSNKSLKLKGISKNDIMAVIERTAENI